MTLQDRLGIWLVRLFLAALFIFASEVLFWIDFARYDLLDWALRGAGYVALATLMLDLAVRFRIRDLYDAMTLLAIYGLLAGTLITAETGFSEFPVTLITRVLGAHTVLGFYLFGVFLTLLGDFGRRARIFMCLYAIWLGFYWGIWLRWQPEINGLFPAVDLQTLLLVAGVSSVILGVLFLASRRVVMSWQVMHLRLSLVGLLVLILVLVGLFMVQALAETITRDALLLIAFLLVVCFAVLWFRHEPDEAMLLDRLQQPASILWLIPLSACFIGAATGAYLLPLIDIPNLPILLNQLSIIEVYFALAGISWLPLIAIVVAQRGIDYQMRTGLLDG